MSKHHTAAYLERRQAMYKATPSSPHCVNRTKKPRPRLGIFAETRCFIAHDGRVNRNERPW